MVRIRHIYTHIQLFLVSAGVPQNTRSSTDQMLESVVYLGHGLFVDVKFLQNANAFLGMEIMITTMSLQHGDQTFIH